MTGFLTFFLAFLLCEQPIASIDGVLLLGIVVAAAGVGNSLGSWVLGAGLGISLPLIPQLGFGVLSALLLGLLIWTVVAWRLRLTRTPRAADSVPPMATADQEAG